MPARLTFLVVLAFASCAPLEQTAGPGTIAGTVTLEATQSLPPFDVLVDANGGLADVLVKLTRVQGEVPEPAQDPLVFVIENTIDMGIEHAIENSRFRPHVAGIQAGREFTYETHGGPVNQRWIPKLNDAPGIERDGKLIGTNRPEVTLIVSDIYPSVGWVSHAGTIFPGMHAHLVIIEHPWFAVSTDGGSFTIEDVPPGTYGLEAWHPTLGTRVLSEVTVSAGATARVKFIFRS